jgi:hypothetical protein
VPERERPGRRIDCESGEPGEQLPQHDAGLQPGGRRPQAVVRSQGEGQVMRGTGPQEITHVRIGPERTWIPVRRPVEQQHFAATGDQLPVQRGVPGERAGQALDGRGQPEQFFDGGGQQVGLG